MTSSEAHETPMPPAEWLAKHSGPGSKGSAGFGWQAGWESRNDEVAQLHAEIKRLSTALDIVALREIRQAADVAIGQRTQRPSDEVLARGGAIAAWLYVAATLDEITTTLATKTAELRRRYSDDLRSEAPFALLLAAEEHARRKEGGAS